MPEESIRLEHDGAISTLIVNRPDALNALNAPALKAMREAIDAVEHREGVRCLIVTGAGDKAFVAGADISAMREMSETEAREFGELGHGVMSALEELPMPVVAAVNGFALGGGCELALAADFIYASNKAKFGQPEVKLGIVPGFGGTQRLARRIGLGMACELIYTGRVMGAEEALRVGLVNAVVPRDELLARTRETAAEIAKMGPLAVTAAKRLMLRGMDRPLPEALRDEVDAFSGCFETADQDEGMQAFLDKRAAEFQGK